MVDLNHALLILKVLQENARHVSVKRDKITSEFRLTPYPFFDKRVKEKG
jgi:hypothetical protein